MPLTLTDINLSSPDDGLGTNIRAGGTIINNNNALIESAVESLQGRLWTIRNTTLSPLVMGARYMANNHAGITFTLPAAFAISATAYSDIWIANADDASNVTLTPASGDALFVDGVTLGVDATYALTAGSLVIVSPRTTDSQWDVLVVGNYVLPEATSTTMGGIELFSDTDNPTAANAVTSTAARTYGLQLNASGQGVMNVPWTDTVYTLPAATTTVLGGIELEDDTVQGTAANAVTTTASRTYGLQVNASGQGVVNVPWVDTNTVYTLPEATSTVRGGIELFSNTDNPTAANAVTSTASRTYGLQLNAAGQGVVNVPWVDTNTVYTHPNDGVDPGAALTGANVFSDITVNAAGHVTGSATRALAAANIGAATLELTQNSRSAAYTLLLADSGRHILHPSADTTARTFTIPANASVAFPIGTGVTFVNQASAGVVTIAITSDTMRLAGAGTTGSRTLAANGIATALKITTTEWIISGTNLT